MYVYCPLKGEFHMLVYRTEYERNRVLLLRTHDQILAAVRSRSFDGDDASLSLQSYDLVRLVRPDDAFDRAVHRRLADDALASFKVALASQAEKYHKRFKAYPPGFSKCTRYVPKTDESFFDATTKRYYHEGHRGCAACVDGYRVNRQALFRYYLRRDELAAIVWPNADRWDGSIGTRHKGREVLPHVATAPVADPALPLRVALDARGDHSDGVRLTDAPHPDALYSWGVPLFFYQVLRANLGEAEALRRAIAERRATRAKAQAEVARRDKETERRDADREGRLLKAFFG